MQTIDSIKPPSPKPPNPRQAGTTPRSQQSKAQAPLPQTGARFTKLRSTSKKKRSNRDILIALLVSPVLLGLSLASVVGMAALGLYGVVAVVRRVSSRTSFTLALMAFVYMFGLQLFALAAWAQTEAVLAYILLTTGAVSLAFETRRGSGMWSRQQ